MPRFMDSAFTYDTVALISIRNKWLGILHRILQLVILGYIIGWSIIYQKSYQVSDEAVGAADIKIKGAAWLHGQSPLSVYDATDLVVPATERDATFLTTAIMSTRNQTRGICSWNDPSNLCSNGCSNGKQVNVGIQTGECSNDHVYCNLAAWCPTENDLTPTMLDGIANFTVFIRLNVQFQRFDVTLDNTGDLRNATMGVNLWRVSDIIEEAGLTNQWDEIKMGGAIIALRTTWNCDFDYSASKCKPSYRWSRIDNPQSQLSVGFNFRDADFYDNGVSRDQNKRYGLRLFVIVSGKGSKFNFVALLTTLGAGLGLLSVATVIGDIIAIYLLGKKSLYYRHNKYREVRDDPHAMEQAIESPTGRSDYWEEPLAGSPINRY